ncbi:MAG: hypothetical protein LIO69_09570 [Oscillospiraceae bacterium]|nr:hypothetical protein [Oscillospiraceae bacterium]
MRQSQGERKSRKYWYLSCQCCPQNLHMPQEAARPYSSS